MIVPRSEVNDRVVHLVLIWILEQASCVSFSVVGIVTFVDVGGGVVGRVGRAEELGKSESCSFYLRDDSVENAA